MDVGFVAVLVIGLYSKISGDENRSAQISAQNSAQSGMKKTIVQIHGWEMLLDFFS